MATSLSGGCACGAVRYECSADPLFAGNCHCRDCQKASGAAFSSNIGVPNAALKITGAVKYHEVVADSGNRISRAFCANCGSRLFARSSGNPDLVVLAVGTLDNPASYQPMMEIYTSSAQPWTQQPAAMAQFPKMPPQG